MLHKHTLALWRWSRSLDLTILFAIFVACSLAWGVVELADEVLEGETESFDTRVLLLFRVDGDPSDPLGPRYVEEMMRDITALGSMSIITLATLGVIGYLLLSERRATAIIVLVATLGAFGLSNAAKELVDRPRPDLVPHGTEVYTQSFPSGHSMQSAATYLTMAALLAQVQKRRRIKVFILAIAGVITLLVGVSRVYLGVHWPTDVLAGWSAGAGWALGCWMLARWLYVKAVPEA